MTPLAWSAVYIRGMRHGIRLCGYSLLRRFLVALTVTAILWGASIALLWQSYDVFSRVTTGEPASIKTLTSLQGFCAVLPCPGWPKPKP